MNENEVESAMRFLVGMWPTPALTEEEAKALRHVLEPYSQLEVRTALSDLQNQGHAMRPAPAQLVTALRSVRSRVAARQGRELPPEPAVERRDAIGWIERARGELADGVARGDRQRSLERRGQS